MNHASGLSATSSWGQPARYCFRKLCPCWRDFAATSSSNVWFQSSTASRNEVICLGLCCKRCFLDTVLSGGCSASKCSARRMKKKHICTIHLIHKCSNERYHECHFNPENTAVCLCEHNSFPMAPFFQQKKQRDGPLRKSLASALAFEKQPAQNT